MQPKEHLFYSTAASAALWPIFQEKTLCFFAASILIDVDHYVDSVYFSRFRDWSLRNMLRFHGALSRREEMRTQAMLMLQAFHTVEFFAAIFFLAWYLKSDLLFLVFAGLVFHIALDFIRLREEGKLGIRAISFATYIWFKRKWRARGQNPESIGFEVQEESLESKNDYNTVS